MNELRSWTDLSGWRLYIPAVILSVALMGLVAFVLALVRDSVERVAVHASRKLMIILMLPASVAMIVLGGAGDHAVAGNDHSLHRSHFK